MDQPDQQQPQQTAATEHAQVPAPTSTPASAPTHGHTKIMSVLCYVGIFALIPFFMAKDDPTVKFHLKQGFVLLTVEVAMWVLTSMLFMSGLWQIVQLVNIATFILSIIGIINVLQGHQKELPLVGSFSSHFTF